jgi:hypothetical protein
MLGFINRISLFPVLAILVVFAFFYLRPLNESSNRLIGADGLGYYSYLPAKFIYNDRNLTFDWFDEVFNRNYDNHVFEKPTSNFMVACKGKMINKYYPGLSLLQLPFFLLSHVIASLFDYPTDGFSLPYQLGIAISALFYCVIGLFFSRQLIFKVFNDAMLANIVPILIFFGTNLFTYTIFLGCYSHCYSFCMITLVYYSAWMFFNQVNKKIVWLFLVLLFCTIVLSIRPLNCILLVGLLYFYKPILRHQFIIGAFEKWMISFLVACIVFFAYYSLSIIHLQTGSFLINTYVGEKFYLKNWPHIADNLFGFQYGFLWYSPLILICLFSIFFVKQNPRILLLLSGILLLIMIYSFWWYWNIVARVIVDCSIILALLLAFLFVKLRERPKVFKLFCVLSCLSLPIFQLKAYQLRAHIIDNNYTYAKYYFKYFFTLHPVHVFPVNPGTVIGYQADFRDFEHENAEQVTMDRGFEGHQSALLNSNHEYACTQSFKVPAFFNTRGFKKIRIAFWMYLDQDISNVHLICDFRKHDNSVLYQPFYIGKQEPRGRWFYNEFGRDVPDNIKAGDDFSVYFWNPDKRDVAFIDNLKVEFILTNGADEVTFD